MLTLQEVLNIMAEQVIQSLRLPLAIVCQSVWGALPMFTRWVIFLSKQHKTDPLGIFTSNNRTYWLEITSGTRVPPGWRHAR